MHRSLTARALGFATSLLCTLIAFFLILHPDSSAIPVLFALAFVQFLAQSICFLNVLSEQGTRWNLIVFISTLSVLFVIVAGSIWIMHRLNENMMNF